MIMRLAITIFLLLSGAFPALAQTLDPHRIFEERCARCHTEHSVDFTHESMSLAGDNRVTGSVTGELVDSFLTHHKGGLPVAEIAALTEMFRRQLENGNIFRRKCVMCHKRAVMLARRKLIIRENKLWGRYTGNDMEDILPYHGRMTPGEVSTMIRTLLWHLETAG